MTARRLLVSAPGRLSDELLCAPDRLAGSIRITIAALIVATVMLVFRMPFLAIGPYLIFILSQRDTLLTRAAAILAILTGILACSLIYLVAFFAWDLSWLRISLLILIFFLGYYAMGILAEPRIILGALVVLALFTGNFDTVPFPNKLLNQLGWIWAIFGLIFASTFLTQWLLQAPSAWDVFRSQMRRLLAATEAACLERAWNRTPQSVPLANERAEAAARLRMLAVSKGLQSDQADICREILNECTNIHAFAQSSAPDITTTAEKAHFRSAASWLRAFRFRVLRGTNEPCPSPCLPASSSPLWQALANLQRTMSPPPHPERPADHKRPSLIRPDGITNPQYAAFAARATLATMGCYVFMTMANWGDIHTCMITCVVTALALNEQRIQKQKLRIAGALIGGLMGIAAVTFYIPVFDSFTALLPLLAVGSLIAAWVSLGSKQTSYAGWQMALAFYMTILQAPHPVTKIDVIWDRWVGIVVGIIAMQTVFCLPTLKRLSGGKDTPQAPASVLVSE